MDRHHRDDLMNLSECDPSREAIVDQEAAAVAAARENCQRELSKAHACEEGGDESHRETKNHGSRIVSEEVGLGTAKCATNVVVAGESEAAPRCWAEMLPDALARIFSHISIHDMLGNIPLVCRSWRRASNDAVCWRREKVDLEDCNHAAAPIKEETLEKILFLLLTRSRGCLQEIFAPKLSNDDMFRLIAWRLVYWYIFCRLKREKDKELCVCINPWLIMYRSPRSLVG